MTILAPQAAVDTSFDGLRIRRVAGNIGGEVLDFKLHAGLIDAQADALHQALVKHKVLFFRDQALSLIHISEPTRR